VIKGLDNLQTNAVALGIELIVIDLKGGAVSGNGPEAIYRQANNKNRISSSHFIVVTFRDLGTLKKLQKMRIKDIAPISIALLIVVGIFIYFVSGISYVYPDIKQYEFNEGMKQFKNKLVMFTSQNKKVSFSINDTTGNKNDGYAYYYTVNFDNNEYDLKCEEKEFQNSIKTEISIVGAHNFKKRLGGYRIGDDGVKNLVNVFDEEIIKGLNVNQNTVIVPIPK
jgi:hypothetical protein